MLWQMVVPLNYLYLYSFVLNCGYKVKNWLWNFISYEKDKIIIKD